MANTKPIINPTPKAQFQSSSLAISAHRDIFSGERIQQSINMALLQYQLRLAVNTQDSNAAAANMFKLKGALEYIDELLKLAEAPQESTNAKITQLDHRA